MRISYWSSDVCSSDLSASRRRAQDKARRSPPSGGRGRKRQHEVDDVGFVAQLELLGVAEVVAVDLVGERAVAGDGDRREVGAVVGPARAPQVAARAER